MKRDGTHPKYQKILFVDSSTGAKFICGAAMDCEEKETYQGKEYPVCYVSISSSSHPFFSGRQGLVDTEKRIDKFRNRYKSKNEEEAKKVVEKAAVKPVKKAKK